MRIPGMSPCLSIHDVMSLGSCRVLLGSWLSSYTGSTLLMLQLPSWWRSSSLLLWFVFNCYSRGAGRVSSISSVLGNIYKSGYLLLHESEPWLRSVTNIRNQSQCGAGQLDKWHEIGGLWHVELMLGMLQSDNGDQRPHADPQHNDRNLAAVLVLDMKYLMKYFCDQHLRCWW